MRAIAVFSMLFALCVLSADAAFTGRSLLQAATPFDWGRPCTLLGSASESQITGPNNAACTPCGSGATATPEPTCTFKALTYKVGDSISISYHSSVHHLYIGAAPCAFTTEICPNATATDVSNAKPCTYKFTTPGSFVISDKAGSGGADDGSYCKDFGAQLPVTVTSSS